MSKSDPTNKKRKAISDFKLSTLLEITNAINNNLTESELFVLFEDILKNQLNIGKTVIYLSDNDVWNVVMRYGVSKTDLMINIEQELKKITDITVVNTARVGNSSSFDVVIPVFHQSKTLAYMLLGDLDEDARKPSPIIKHLGFIQTLANITAVAVQNKRLEEEHLEQERMLQELKMASNMQAMLLPKTLPNNDYLKAFAYYKPHQEVGGDFYDIIEINEDETVFCIADVSGKGMSAAIMMANFQANVRANVKVEHDLKKVMQNLNNLVWENADGERYITCFLARYNHKTRALHYINAAHPAAIILDGKSPNFLSSGAVGIGMFEEMPILDEGQTNLSPNSLMLFFTDGITETTNTKGEQFQEKEMLMALDHLFDLETTQVNQQFMKHLDKFRGKMPYADDVALVSCRFI
ncbi:MAG: SpoIIE family protein phosphatase [Salibacteraceae bacterium]